ncbi:GNAT family N-acetyltransferase [Paenibacillus sp. GCM10023252]|uniref:GNAT family N-acetyltransferase n=1 Tax=Paenibacillus sp. GCM10023252 TaxID=3252649 RepID=UPI00360BCC31
MRHWSYEAGALAVRPLEARDEELRLHIYRQTREEEMAGWGWDEAQREAFLRMQFDFQQRSYAVQYPDAQYEVVLAKGVPAGYLMVERSAAAIRLVDLALLSEYRNAGIGTAVLRGLQEEAQATGRPIKLHVLHTNPARRLYERLGFRPVEGGGEVHMAMVWQPAARRL